MARKIEFETEVFEEFMSTVTPGEIRLTSKKPGGEAHSFTGQDALDTLSDTQIELLSETLVLGSSYVSSHSEDTHTS